MVLVTGAYAGGKYQFLPAAEPLGSPCFGADGLACQTRVHGLAVGMDREKDVQKIMVCLKRVVDYNVRIRVKEDGSGVVTEGVKMSINPFDEIALEEALRIREAGQPVEIVAVSIGPEDCQQQLRTGLAMGADRGILLEADSDVEPLTAARALLTLVKREQPDLVLLGKQAIDDDCNQTGQMLAALWERPQATFASRIEIRDDMATVTREVDDGLEVIRIELPAVVTTDLRLNEPRYVKLPDIMKAKKKPLEREKLAALGVDATPRLRSLKYEAPAPRQKGRMVADVDQLISALREKGFFN